MCVYGCTEGVGADTHLLFFELFHNGIFQKNGFAVTGVLFLKIKGLNIRKCNMNSLKCKDLGKKCFYVSIGDLYAVRCVKCGEIISQTALCKTEGCRRKTESDEYCKHCTDIRDEHTNLRWRKRFQIGETVIFFKSDNRVRIIPEYLIGRQAKIVCGPQANGTYRCKFLFDDVVVRIHRSKLKRVRGREVVQTITDGTENV